MKKLNMKSVSHWAAPSAFILAIGVVGGFMLFDSHSVSAATCGPAGAWSSSATNGSHTDSGYFFDNNEWGAVSGSAQTIWEQSPTSWGICSFQPNPPTGVKTYAEEQQTVNQPINSFATMTNTVSYTLPSKGTWASADDLWINGTPGQSGAIEVMIWTYNHSHTPAGTDEGNVTIGSQNYTFWKKTGSGPIYTFVYATNETSTTVHMLSAFNWLASQGYISTSDTFSQFNWGYEIVGTNESTEDFTTTNFVLTLTPN